MCPYTIRRLIWGSPKAPKIHINGILILVSGKPHTMYIIDTIKSRLVSSIKILLVRPIRFLNLISQFGWYDRFLDLRMANRIYRKN